MVLEEVEQIDGETVDGRGVDPLRSIYWAANECKMSPVNERHAIEEKESVGSIRHSSIRAATG